MTAHDGTGEPTQRHRLWQIVGGYFLTWTLLGLFFATRDLTRRAYLGDPIDWGRALTSWLVGEYIWGVVALLVLWFGMRWPLERRAIGRRVAIHFALSVMVAAGQLALEATAYKQLGTTTVVATQSVFRSWLALMIIGFHNNVVAYWVILGLQTGYRYYRQLQEREGQALRLELQTASLNTQLARARLSALKMQLQPHFLFNTLNAIVVLVRDHSASRAEEMIARLSDLLRWVLAEAETQEVPLRRELDYVRLYLSIEEVRFDDRLTVVITADPAALDAAVPHLALQPLVENALRHGIARSMTGGTIRITASVAGGSLAIEVKDDGPGLASDASTNGAGIGLANVRARLAALYGDGASLTVQPGHPGTTVTLTLPFHALPDETPSEAFDAAQLAHR